MPLFHFTARGSDGKVVEGEYEADTIELVQSHLGSLKLVPLTTEEKPKEFSLSSILQKNPTPKDIANLTRQFQVMFATGTPMDKILATLARQTKNPGLKDALTHIQKDVAHGTRPSTAFKKYPKYFSSLYTSMLEVGETGGFLDKTLKEMAKILEKEYEIHTKVKSATLYPKIVVFVLAVVSWGMLAYVIPPFQNFYSKFGADLPLPTKIMLTLSKLTTTYWYVPVITITACVIAWKQFVRTDVGKRFTSKVGLQIPVFGKMNALIINARFGHLISGLYRAGVPLTSALNVVASTVTNVFYAQEILDLKHGIEQGESLSKCMERTKYFEPMVQEACAVGEKIGKIDDLLESTAHFYDGEVDDMLKNLSTLIEPFLLVILFGAVLLLALAIYMPMWNISKVVLPH